MTKKKKTQKKSLKTTRKKIVKRKKKVANEGSMYTAHMGDMIKRITELENRVAELEGFESRIKTWAAATY